MKAKTDALAIPHAPADVTGGIAKLRDWATGLVIQTAAQYNDAIFTLKNVKAMRQRVVDFFAESKQAAFETHRAITKNERSFTDALDIIERQAKTALTEYTRIEEQKRVTEQRRLQAEADEKARKEREALEAKAAKLKTPEKQERLLEQAATIVAPVVEVASTVPEVAGVSGRQLWYHRIVDKNSLPLEWLVPNDKALAAFARSTKGQVPIKGVEFYSETSIAIGGN